MFQSWQNFYLLLGPAAGALIGLLFVVATLTARLDHSSAQRGAGLYMTPNLFHFGVVLVVSAITLVPGIGATVEGGLIEACAVVGFGYATATAGRLRGGRAHRAPHWSDFWCYAVAPAGVYVALGAGASATWWAAAAAPYGIAVALMSLLLVAIRNAWDLVTWLAPRRDGT